MCMRYIGEKRDVTKKTAWKVVSEKDVWTGPFYKTVRKRNGWSSVRVIRGDTHSSGGYHVFDTREAAETYLDTGDFVRKVIKVRVAGQERPFETIRRGRYFEGRVVRQWQPFYKRDRE